ncbi:MAG: DUF4396 domain-containing protein [Halanaeroarchaeum sp.]
MALAQTLLAHPALATWTILVAASLLGLGWDLRQHNRAIAPLMQLVWTLTVLYSGPLGLAAYRYAGRRQIDHDSPWRKGMRSTAHCYSGCGAGEVTGVVAAVVVGLATLGTTLLTFGLAYLFGYALTVGPLVQGGESLRAALEDALVSETPSITVMEIVAIGTDQLLAGGATFGEPTFWTSLLVSLTLGFLAAYPVNRWLISRGVKGGMQNPASLEPAT